MRRTSTAISPSAYSGGTIAIHAPNFANYFAQAQQHKMAKQQALSQYYDRVQTSINPQGVRDVDMNGWQKKADDWNKFGIDHRDDLVDPRRDGGRSLTQFNSMHRDLLGDLQKSKQAAAKEMMLQRIYSDPKKASLATKNDLLLAHGLSSSIYDSNHYKDDGVTPHDLSEFSFNAAPYDIKKQVVANQEITRGMKKDRTLGAPGAVDRERWEVRIPYTEQHSKSNLTAIGNRMGQLYDGDPSMQQYYENQTIDPDTYNKRNQAYKGVFGKDEEIGNDYKKHAIADAILNNSQQDRGELVRSVPQPRVGRTGGVAGQQYQDMVNWVNGTAGAIQSGNESELKRFGSQLYQGAVKNSRYQDVDLGPFQTGATNDAAGIKKGAIFHHIDHQYVYDNPNDPKSYGSWKDVPHTTNFDAQDPYLRQKLVGYYQSHMGRISKLGQTPFYQQGQQVPDDDDQPVVPNVAPPPKAAPIDPDALIKKYSSQ